MPPTIVITVQEGDHISQEVRFENGPTACSVGRAVDCEVRLPCDDAHSEVSRRHCVLDINPPGASVRDLGSLNGTFVNGLCIGMREPGDPARTGPPRRLRPGDVIRLGHTLLRFDVLSPEEDDDLVRFAAEASVACSA
jgi:serine/threonine-protein kinase